MLQFKRTLSQLRFSRGAKLRNARDFIHCVALCFTRMNFTLRHMDVSCEAYDHFRRCLSQLHGLVDGRCSFTVEQLPCDFSQSLLYERIDQLVRDSSYTHDVGKPN